jgi:hypothetical protein
MARQPLAASGHELDWIDRSICAYLVLPLLLFCLWFTPPVAGVLLMLAGYGVYRILCRGDGRPAGISTRWLLAVFALSFGWIALAGVGHFFYANADWVMRDAVLHDLSVAPWPARYSAPDSSIFILRAPIGYFLPAAAFGRAAGPEAADAALYLWTVLGWGLMLAAALRLFDTRAQRILCLLVLVGFGGMDLLGYLWAHRAAPPIGGHIEWWAQVIQYSSNTTLLFWAPNHALPAWLGAILILHHWRQPALALVTPLLAASIPLWSPLAAIGLFPFFLFGLAWRRDFKDLFSLHSCFPFLPIAVAIALYLGMDAGSVRHGWQIENFPSTMSFAYYLVLFCLLEFGVLALVLARLGPLDPPLRIALVVLCLLPLYSFGPGNDLAMRSSIPALTVLALATVKPLALNRGTLWHGLLVLVLVIGALGAAQEPLRTLSRPRWEPKMQTLPRATPPNAHSAELQFPVHYLAPANSDGIQMLMRKSTPIDVSREGGT